MTRLGSIRLDIDDAGKLTVTTKVLGSKVVSPLPLVELIKLAAPVSTFGQAVVGDPAASIQAVSKWITDTYKGYNEGSK